MRCILLLLLLTVPAAAADPVTVVLPERASCGAAVATVGHIATVLGSGELKAAVAAIDLTDMPVRDASILVTRRQVETRLQLAGLKVEEFRVLGAEKTTVVADRKPVPVEDVILAAKAAVLHRLPLPADEIQFDLVKPVVAKMPEVGTGEPVDIKAEPHGNNLQMGRLQVNVTICTRGQQRLSLPVLLEAKRVGDAAPAARVVPPPGGGEVLVKARQRVDMVVTVGELRVVAKGEAQQDGRMGALVRVQNVDSKKVLTGRVTAAGTVVVE